MGSQAIGSSLWGGPISTTPSGTVSVAMVIRSALRIAGITLRPQRTPSEDQAQEALDQLNAMIGQWNTQSLLIYTKQINAWPLVSNQKTYTIGPGGQFDGDRPQWIDQANLILNSVSPVVRLPLTIWNDEEWSLIPVQDIGRSLPLGIYNDGAYPLSTIYVWPQPLTTYALELYTWSAIPLFSTIGDAVVLPPGYQMAIEYNLAVILAEHYPHESKILPSAYRQAEKALAKIKGLNSVPNKQRSDAASINDNGNRSSFNYYTGQIQ